MKLLEPETAPLVHGLEDLQIKPAKVQPTISISEVEDQGPPRANPRSSRTPVRLVVCVDGTWGEPDGLHQAFEGNTSNIYRIHCSIKEGEVRDSSGTRWMQRRKYFKGLNDPTKWVGKLMAGAFAAGIDQQIKDVYRYCCEQASYPEDEIYFFGFSRGAFVVRAVANMLSYLDVPGRGGESSPAFDEIYEEGLGLYKDIREGSIMKKASIHAYRDKCHPPPTIRFVGVLDTVKAFDDKGLYDIRLIDSLHHCRQALALNERKIKFKPEIWSAADSSQMVDSQFQLRSTSDDHSLLQAWFIGTHGNLGGGCAQDGCALYPLQWLLSEARDVGLSLGFKPMTRTTAVLRKEVDLDDPVALVFPKQPSSSKEDAGQPYVFTSKNGIRVNIWDITSVHRDQGYRLRINNSVNRWIYSEAARDVFDQDSLMGYHDEAPIGLFIHPSAYLVYDIDLHISSNSRDWGFWEEFCNFRDNVLPTESDKEEPFWDRNQGLVEDHIEKVRILICGPAGVGKSSLLNKVLGGEFSPECETAHGAHDINVGFSPEGAHYVVHDSCGFTVGDSKQVDEVKTFLKSRSSSADLSERLHVVWYCVPCDRLRTTEPADKVFFDTMAKADSSVPIVLLFTRKDKMEVDYNAEARKDYLAKHGIKSERSLSDVDWDAIDEDGLRRIESRKAELVKGFAGHQFLGPIYVCKDDEGSIKELVEETTGCLTNHKVRELFIAAQICSIQPKIDTAISNSLRLYAHAVRTAAVPVAFSGVAGTTTVSAIICTDILKIFQYPTFSTDIASRTIKNAFVANWEANLLQLAGQGLGYAGGAAAATGFGAVAGATLLAAATAIHTIAIPQFGRLLLMCTVDVVLIMERVQWKTKCKATAKDVEDACVWYRGKVGAVHQDVKKLLPVWALWSAFKYDKLKVGLAKIVDEHRFGKDTGETHHNRE